MAIAKGSGILVTTVSGEPETDLTSRKNPALAGVGEIVSTHVIPRPHTNVDAVLPLGRSPKKGK